MRGEGGRKEAEGSRAVRRLKEGTETWPLESAEEGKIQRSQSFPVGSGATSLPLPDFPCRETVEIGIVYSYIYSLR